MSLWVVLCAVGVLFWGAWGLVLRIALIRDGDFLSVNAATALGILAVSVATYLMLAQPPQVAFTATLLLLVLATGLTGGLGQLCYSRALEHGPVAVVVPMYALSPIITVVLSVAFLGEHLNGRQILGVVLAFISSFILSLKESSDE